MSYTQLSATSNWSPWYQSSTTFIVGGSPEAHSIQFDMIPDTAEVFQGPFQVQVIYPDSSGPGYVMQSNVFTADGGAVSFDIPADTAGHVYFRVISESTTFVGLRVTDGDSSITYDSVSPEDVPSWHSSDPDYVPPDTWHPAALPEHITDAKTPWATAPHEISPLVIDLSSGHTGITLTTFDAATTTTFFDMNASGFTIQTAWVSGDTGLLAEDLNSNGKIDSVDELFGSSTVDGFAKLATLDSNHDLKIDSHDTAWGSLVVWTDSNGDGVTQDGELHSLSDLGIASIDLAGVAASTSTIDGNPISHTSTVTFTDNSTAAIDDAWFVGDAVNSYYNGDYTLDPDTLFLPDLRGYGMLPDLTIAMSQGSDLKGMVSDFVSAFGSSGFASSTLDSDAAGILYQWAGVESVASDSRGIYVDAQQLEFLEHLYAQNFFQNSTQSADPMSEAASLIDQSWSAIFETFKNDLILQAGGSSIFENAVTYNVSPRRGPPSVAA